MDAELRRRIRESAPGGGYIVSSGNHLPAYVKPENALALGRAAGECGAYPITAWGRRAGVSRRALGVDLSR